MTEYYRNCGSSEVNVCPIYVGDVNDLDAGTNIAYGDEGLPVAAGATQSWYFSSTYESGNYSIAFD